MKARFHLSLFAVVVASALIAAPVAAGDGWSAPPDHVGDVPVIDRPAVAFHDGVTWIAVAATGPEHGIHLFSVGDSGGSAVVTTRRDRQPSLAIGDNGVFHLAFWRRGTGCAEQPCSAGIFYARSVDGEDWTVERVHRGERDVHPSIALDPVGRPWIFYRNGNKVVESHKVRGDWSNFAFAFGCCGPDALSGPEGTVVGGQSRGISDFIRLITYRDSFDGGLIRLDLNQSDFGKSFTVTNADDAFDPDLLLDDNEDLHVVYRRESGGLWYAFFRANGTFARTQVSSAQIVGPPAIAALPGGDVLIVGATAQRLIYRTDAGGSFSGGPIPESGPSPSGPALATSDAGAARLAFLRGDDLVGARLSTHPASWP